jgi:hypothetical protein
MFIKIFCYDKYNKNSTGIIIGMKKKKQNLKKYNNKKIYLKKVVSQWFQSFNYI